VASDGTSNASNGTPRRGYVLVSATAVVGSMVLLWTVADSLAPPAPSADEPRVARALSGHVARDAALHGAPELAPPHHLRTCCAFGMDLHADFAGVPVPVLEIGNVVGPSELGPHLYRMLGGEPDPENNGLVYTCRGGWIDTAHVREYADLSYFLASRMGAAIASGTTIELHDDTADTSITVAAMPRDVLDRLGPARATETLAAWTSFRLAVWHELATWFGYQTVPGFSEQVSAFSIEDLYSDALGIRLGTSLVEDAAIHDDRAYDTALDELFSGALDELGAQPLDVARTIMGLLDGRWWSSARRLPDDQLVMHRVFPPSGPRVHPWRADDAFAATGVPAPLRLACGGVPALDLPIDVAIDSSSMRAFVTIRWRLGSWADARFPFAHAAEHVVDESELDALVARARAEMQAELGSGFDAP